MHIGSRATTATSDRHTTRLPVQSMGSLPTMRWSSAGRRIVGGRPDLQVLGVLSIGDQLTRWCFLRSRPAGRASAWAGRGASQAAVGVPSRREVGHVGAAERDSPRRPAGGRHAGRPRRRRHRPEPARPRWRRFPPGRCSPSPSWGLRAGADVLASRQLPVAVGGRVERLVRKDHGHRGEAGVDRFDPHETRLDHLTPRGRAAPDSGGLRLRRVGAHSPGSHPSLSVTLSIGITLRPTEPSVPSAPDWRLAAAVC